MIGGNKFGEVKLAPPDPILGMSVAFRNDPSPDKVDMGVGAYRTNEAKPLIFQAVREAERRILDDPTINKEYLPIEGLDSFNRLARDLILGSDCPATAEGRVVTLQTLSGTGSLRIGAECCKAFLNPPCAYVSRPTWGNHNTIFEKAGMQVKSYAYWKESTRGLDLEGMLADLAEAPAGSVVILHACAHNPTGVDPSPAQWDQIADFLATKDVTLYFDSAYQGFATGDLDNDAYAIRSFIRRGFQCFVSQSFAKNTGLYGERIGALHIVTANRETSEKVLSQAKIIVRASYSNPPKHGALIVSRILSDPALKESWINELKDVSKRIIDMRHKLVEELTALAVPGDWSHVITQIGMFSFTGLTPAQCENMINKWHCYMLKNGRISMTGINTSNVAYVARAIKDSVENH
ncbi:hypothetical protein SteCoe_31580 [Stentor coeruleus]|uniref:Aspartate aminotransferase n=1 Tax=Stentor coeruleus TaxID=5963 RepID=A0A1R2B0Z9_9CILI|nr:hypothetical protein SteCoe_31580 [Stentor coeruleus]